MKLSVRNHKRDLKIMHMRKNLKWTFVKIAKEFDITSARARQLYLRLLEERKNSDKESKKMGIGA